MENMVNDQKRVLILGNLGYVGSELIKQLRTAHPDYYLAGFDTGFFSRFLTTDLFSADSFLNCQIYGDVRKTDELDLSQYDSIVALAAISNDPIGNKFEEVTLSVNCNSIVKIAKKAKTMGVKSFVFASSCSVYGCSDEGERTEMSEVNPLTAYAKSKVNTENHLREFASNDFKVTCLRFATACGMSDRLRLDLVLNDFVASAIANNHIEILSDGTSWRPLINVKDMSLAIDWAMHRKGDAFVIVNAGSNEWNFKVKELAEAVKEIFPDISISINKNAVQDKRSYRVNFDKFKKLAPEHQPRYTLIKSIIELKEGLEKINFCDKEFRKSNYIRLNVINQLINRNIIDNNLFLIKK